MLLTRKIMNRKATYKAGIDNRKSLMRNEPFCKAFAEQKRRVRTMEFRCVEESNPIRQMLLEVYCAVVLKIPFNDFDNH